jgi:hypothetical protein
LAISDANGVTCVEAWLYPVGGQTHFAVYCDEDAQVVDTGVSVQTGEWYCIEIAVKRDASGWVKMWVNGALTEHDADLSGIGQLQYFSLGAYPSVGVSCTAYGDSAVVDTTYIEPQQYTPNLQMSPNNVTCREYLETFNVQINVTNAVNAQAFNFTIYYDPSVINYSSVTWGQLGTGTLTTIDTTNGIIEGNVAGTAVTGNCWLLNITFQADQGLIWKQGQPNTLQGQIWFNQAELNFTDDPSLQYVQGGVNQINVNQANYNFQPIQGDVNNDGTVNILDLSTVAHFYNVQKGDPTWPAASTYDLNGDGIIDIYDLVIVASNWGYTYTPQH